MSTDFALLAYPMLTDTASDELQERARVQGHAAGYAAGRREATATLAADRATLALDAERTTEREVAAVRLAAAALSAAALQFASRASAELAASEESMLAAAVEIATVIVGDVLADHEVAAVAAVRRALGGAESAIVQRVRLHPADLALAVGAVEGVQLVADPALDRGDAVAELADGTVDARVSRALDRVRAELKGEGR